MWFGSSEFRWRRNSERSLRKEGQFELLKYGLKEATHSPCARIRTGTLGCNDRCYFPTVSTLSRAKRRSSYQLHYKHQCGCHVTKSPTTKTLQWTGLYPVRFGAHLISLVTIPINVTSFFIIPVPINSYWGSKAKLQPTFYHPSDTTASHSSHSFNHIVGLASLK